MQGRGVVRSTPTTRVCGHRALIVGGDPGDEAAAALDEDRVERLALLAHDLHPHRALAGDDVLVVEGRDDESSLESSQS